MRVEQQAEDHARTDSIEKKKQEFERRQIEEDKKETERLEKAKQKDKSR